MNNLQRTITASMLATLALSMGCAQAQPVKLSKQKFADKCKGAWAGQIIGCTFGGPYEFKSNAKPITKPLQPWKPERVQAKNISHSGLYDDCYVETTFLASLEKHGLDISYEQAGKDFADTKYPLWHANFNGRNNVRNGIMPPMSGHPKYNRHADDIDFQIEADTLGIICPGMPQECNRICDIFGRIMNYGDGLYGGMFVAGMYTGAYLEDKDVNKVIKHGLACIPKQSLYHKCISDVIRWHKENPNDWLATWHKIEKKWQDDVDCKPGVTFNIDAKLNGAYIVMGLLYGEGDFMKTIEISCRCGQDADCNPSNAAGVLGCMIGFEAIGEKITSGLTAAGDAKFNHTEYSFNNLIPACLGMAEKIALRAGGKVTGDDLIIALQKPKAAKLEQWENQLDDFKTAISQHEMDQWNKGWKLVACASGKGAEWRGTQFRRPNVIKLYPPNLKQPAIIASTIKVPAQGKPKMYINVASDKNTDFLLKVVVDNKQVKKTLINTKGKWICEEVDLAPFAGKKVNARIETHATSPKLGYSYLSDIAVK